MYYQTRKNPHGGDVYKQKIMLDFSINLNPLGMPRSAAEAARKAVGEADRYPDPYCRALVSAIAAAEGVPEGYVLCGNGASELIYAYCAAVRPARAVELAPAFSEYSAALELAGCRVTRYALREKADFALDAGFPEYLRAAAPEAVFLCNPNNPTGRLIPPAVMERVLEVCRKERIRLFVDECFLALSEGGESLKSRLAANPGLFLLNAFTKTYAMAGLRLGYGLSADAALLRRMSALTPPWNVSGPAQAAGAAALRETEFLRESRENIRTERNWLKAALEILGFRVCPSEANFLLFQGPAGLNAALAEQGIALRDCGNFPGLGPGWYRAAVRRRGDNERLADALREITAQRQSAALRQLLRKE